MMKQQAQLLAALALCSAFAAPAAAQTIAMETAAASSVLGLMPQGMAPACQRPAYRCNCLQARH